MDEIIKRSGWSRNRKWIIWSIGLLSFLVALIWLALRETSPEIDRSKVRFGEVTSGTFQEIIVATGTVEPQKTVLVDSNEGGTVEEIKAEEGEMVSAGDVLVVLSNEALMLDYMQRETQIVEQINNLRNTRINLHQNLRFTEDQLEDFEKELVLVESQYQRDSVLIGVNGLPRKDYEQSKVNYEYSTKKVSTLRKRRNDDRRYHGDQIGRIDNSIRLMERNLEMIRGKLSEMTIKAPITGELNSFDLEPGEVLQHNQTIARVDVPGKYCIRALVDQHYINRLRFGQKGSITFDGKSYELTIRKVLSTVENGQIELFMDFTSGFPENLRRGQSFQVRIETSGEKEAIKVPKGSFYQSSGGQFVYVLSDDGTIAKKQTVEIGRQNPDFYEVIDGLSPGQKVIISSYTGYKDNEQIRLIKN